MAADHSNRIMNPTSLLRSCASRWAFFRVAFDATEEAMLILDDNDQVRWVNRAAAQWLGNGLALRVIGEVRSASRVFHHPDQRDLPYGDRQHPLSQSKQGDGQMLLSIHPLLIKVQMHF